MLDIVDVGWGLIGPGEKSNGMMGWRGVVLGVWLGGGASAGESAENYRREGVCADDNYVEDVRGHSVSLKGPLMALVKMSCLDGLSFVT